MVKEWETESHLLHIFALDYVAFVSPVIQNGG